MSKSKIFCVRIPCDIRSRLEKRAEREGRKLGNLIVFILRNEVQKEMEEEK